MILGLYKELYLKSHCLSPPAGCSSTYAVRISHTAPSCQVKYFRNDVLKVPSPTVKTIWPLLPHSLQVRVKTQKKND